MLTDYQSRANGGDGWLRYYTFKPSENKIYAYTYSPTPARASSRPTRQPVLLDYPMSGLGGFELNGKPTPLRLHGLDPVAGTHPSYGYEWYAVMTDGVASRTSPTWTFTTGAGSSNNPPVVINPGPQTNPEGTASTCRSKRRISTTIR